MFGEGSKFEAREQHKNKIKAFTFDASNILKHGEAAF